MARGLFFPGQTYPVGCALPGFFWLLGTVKGYFKSQSLNFMCTLCVGSYYFGKKSELHKCRSHILRWFLESQSSGILIPYPNHHLRFRIWPMVLNISHCSVQRKWQEGKVDQFR
jgi:hypothetical protein